jgi:hypothetical protein
MGPRVPISLLQLGFISFFPHICPLVFLRGLLILWIVQQKAELCLAAGKTESSVVVSPLSPALRWDWAL